MSFISALVHFSLAGGTPGRYFAGNTSAITTDGKGGDKEEEERAGAWREVWFGGGLFTEALSGFVLGWAGVGGVIR